MSHSVLRNNTANHPENEPNMPESLKTSKALKAEQSTSADSSQSPFSGTTGAPKWNKTDLTWMLSLFGTAIGAGVLFLPINAGIGGIIPLLIMTVVALPMTYWAHRGLSRLVLSSSKPEGDLTDVS